MRKSMMKIGWGVMKAGLIGGISLLLIGCGMVPEPEEDPLDAFCAHVYPEGNPGAVVLVRKGAEILLRKGYGMADLETGAPMKSDSVFQIASNTKAFTATAVMMLVEEGRISLDSSLNEYLLDYPDYGREITIRQLLNHTSGIKNYVSMPEYDVNMRMRALAIGEMVNLFKNQPRDFPPGKSWRYNNSAYILLSAVIEKASGLRYLDFLHQRIFLPLGMRFSRGFSREQVIPFRISGYEINGKDIYRPPYENIVQNWGAGALLSTAGDIDIFYRALENGSLISRESYAFLTTDSGFNQGRPLECGSGFWLSDFRGFRVIENEGYMRGFTTRIFSIPEEGIFIAVFTNSSGREKPDDPRYVAQWIAARLLGQPYPDWRFSEQSLEVLKSHEGVYRIDEKTTRSVSVGRKGLFTMRTDSRRMEALPGSESKFFYPGTFTYLSFEKDDSGRIVKMTVHSPERNEVAVKTDLPLRRPLAVDAVVLDRFTGTYDFGRFTWKLFQEEGRLFVDDGRRRRELFAEAENVFFPEDEDSHWTFVSSNQGEVVSLELRFGSRTWTARKVK